MPDVFSVAKRREIMRGIGGANTRPELVVREIVRALGYSFRLHVDSLPGTPDIVLPRRRRLILIHGCFWHRHHCRKGRSIPTTRRDFWLKKLEGNRRRDCALRHRLNRLGWRIITVWECQTRPNKLPSLAKRLARLLKD